MPKEVVLSSAQFSGDEPTLETGVEVRWGREQGYVQVATTLFESSTRQHVSREVDGGWFIDLDRRGINTLIRHLRRARDQAHGRDE